MWRRVASQSPVSEASAGDTRDYIKSFTALNYLIREGRSVSGGERNRFWLNTQGPAFANASALSGLDFPDDGRAVLPCDWDRDGGIDLWLLNRSAPRIRLMRNAFPKRGGYVAIRLEGKTCNRDAVGARLELKVGGISLHRTLRAGEGFLGQSSKWVHFGIGEAKALDSLIVRWPGGEAERITGISPNARFRVIQGSGAAIPVQVPVAESPPKPGAMAVSEETGAARIVLAGRFPLPAIPFKSIQAGEKAPEQSGPKLINLWATWCQPCLAELADFSNSAAALRAAGVEVLALNVDEIEEAGDDSELPKSRAILKRVKFPFAAGGITARTAGMLDTFHRSYLSLRLALPVPSSFLVDARGNLAVIYRGPVKAEQVLADLALLELEAPDLRDRAAPFAGRWQAPVSPALPHNQALALMRDGFLEEGSAYLKKLLTDAAAGKTSRPPGFPEPGGSDHALLCERAADYYRLLESPDDVVAAMRLALRFDPEFLPAHLALGRAFSRAGRPAEGEVHLRKAAARLPDDPDLRNDLGIALAMQGRLADAEIEFRAAIDRRPDLAGAYENLSRALQGQRKSAEAIEAIARLAEIYAAAGRPADARRAAQRGLDLIRAGDGGTAELRGRLESLAAE